jgi:transcriptional regulator with GAF, ATPase, and Fis domain
MWHGVAGRDAFRNPFGGMRLAFSRRPPTEAAHRGEPPVSKFDLRDISDRLTGSRDTEALVYEFLGYLQAVHPDWRASLAFYEVSQDSLVSVYHRQGQRLVRRDINMPVDHLPARLVRKFFHPSAFFNHADRRKLMTQLFGASPAYEPDPLEAPGLAPLTALEHWQSCVCMPLADAEDVLALLVIVSEKRGAFGGKVVSELIPVKSMAALALAQHLYRAGRTRAQDACVPAAATEFHARIQQLSERSEALAAENLTKNQQLEALTGEIEQLDKHSTQYKQELARVKEALFALEEQSAAATQHLTNAYSELTSTRVKATELQRTVAFMRDVFQLLAQEHDPAGLPGTLVEWFCQHSLVERCSLMLLDSQGETLSIAAQRGIDPAVAGKVRVRVGQGIAGWVSHNRKPLFVRVREEAEPATHTGQDAYNSDSFICVPLTYNDQACGVLNLSNKRDGEAFDEFDLDRAMLAGSIIAMSMGGQEQVRRAASTAWA